MPNCRTISTLFYTPSVVAWHCTQALDTLRSFYGADAVPEPKEFLRTKWASEPYTLGAYSYVRTGSTFDDRAVLAKTVGRNLFLAGEATSSTNPATTHGAYQSGVDAAAALDAMA